MKWKTEHTVLSIIAGLVIAIVIMAFVWSRHECPEQDVATLENQIIEANEKIKEYENKIRLDNAIIDAFNNDELDSVWARIHPNN